MSSPKSVVIDTDPGLDDVLALALALRSTALNVRAITVVAGNVPLRACTKNVLRVLEAIDERPPPPVYPGCDKPLSPPVVRAEHVHGQDGIGGASRRFPVRQLRARPRHAVAALIDEARRYRDSLTVIALGPLTNIASALAQDSEAMRGIGQLVVMGGSADRRGNATPSAEFNFYSDPSAAKAVVRSGMPVLEVGLTVTNRALLPRASFEESLSRMPPGRLRSFLEACASPYFNFCQKHGDSDACALHDPLAVAAVIDPELLRTELLKCDVVASQGLTRGMMLAHALEPDDAWAPINVANSVNTKRFVTLFLETVCGS